MVVVSIIKEIRARKYISGGIAKSENKEGKKNIILTTMKNKNIQW